METKETNNEDKKEFKNRVNFDRVMSYCMNECVTFSELKPNSDMLISMMGDCQDEEWLRDKECLKRRKQELASENVLREVLTKAMADGTVDTLLRQVAWKEPKRAMAPKLSDATFTYRYLEESPQRPMLLYQRLMKGNFISSATPPDDFRQLFEGEPSDVKVKWLGNQASLWYLFKLLLDKKYVRKPEGVGPWVVVQSHFVNAKSNMFANFNKQKIPQKQKGLLEKLAELLNPASDEEWGRE